MGTYIDRYVFINMYLVAFSIPLSLITADMYNLHFVFLPQKIILKKIIFFLIKINEKWLVN